MKRKIEIAAALLLATTFGLPSCEDWTDVDNLSVEYENVEQQNPELYSRYLASLREYRKTDHTLVYAWYDNSVKVPVSRAHYLRDVPDSIDVVGLIHPDSLTQSEIEQMNYLREQKGMKIVYTIDFDGMKTDYTNIVEPADPDRDFRSYLTDTLSYTLSLLKKYPYDGICISYTGKSTVLMDDAEKKEYMENENCFIGILEDWCSRNEGVELTFFGQPDNLLDKTILDRCPTILLDGRTATATNELTTLMTRNWIADYAGRYGMVVAGTPLLGTNKYAAFSDGTPAMDAVAARACTPQQGAGIRAVGVYDFSGDYFNADNTYKNMRNMISTLNPSIK